MFDFETSRLRDGETGRRGGVKEAERSSTDERGLTQMNCKTRVVVERGRDYGLRLQTINYPHSIPYRSRTADPRDLRFQQKRVPVDCARDENDEQKG